MSELQTENKAHRSQLCVPHNERHGSRGGRGQCGLERWKRFQASGGCRGNRTTIRSHESHGDKSPHLYPSCPGRSTPGEASCAGLTGGQAQEGTVLVTFIAMATYLTKYFTKYFTKTNGSRAQAVRAGRSWRRM